MVEGMYAAACFLITLKERSLPADRICETQRYQIFLGHPPSCGGFGPPPGTGVARRWL